MEWYHSDRGIYYIIIGWTLTVILLVVVALRLYSRAALTRSIGSDDFCIAIAAGLSFYCTIQDTIAVAQGLGRHESLLSPLHLKQVNKWLYICWIVAYLTFFFVRASSIVTITQQVNGILTCVIDITTSLTPQFILWNIQIKRSTKLTLNFLFGLGFITAGLSIARVLVVNSSTWATDTSWRSMQANTIAMVEEKCGIVLASGPAIRQFVAHWQRTGTCLPSKTRQAPKQEFGRFHQQRAQASDSELSNDTKKRLDKTAQISTNSSIAEKTKHFFTGGKHRAPPNEESSGTDTASGSSKGTNGKPWNHDTSSSESQSQLQLDERGAEREDHKNVTGSDLLNRDIEAARPQED
ncbi:MAG: hypothetical protein M1820_002121 [Bogoriella megaspora]|nr:MAG: hypothetical protein M1820_002121 [Bogoriella megaspora]